MRREITDMVIGLVLIVVGIIIMLFVFSLAMNLAFSAGDYFREQFPEEEVVEGPSAEFSWNTVNLSVTFQDDSVKGDGDIVSWEWDFDDGSGDDVGNPSHPYATDGNYQVRLRIEDENGKRSSARGDVQVQTGQSFQGFSETDSNGSGINADFGDVILPIATAILVGVLFIVMFAVGAAITKAGWNILKPKPEKLKIKLKPKEMEIKQVGTFASAPPEPVQYTEQMPPEQYSPPPPEDYQQEP